MKDNPGYASRERLSHLQSIADQLNGATNDVSQQIRNLRDEHHRLNRRLRDLEGAPGMERLNSEDQRRHLAEQLEALDADVALLNDRYRRLSTDSQIARATYNAAVRRARELGLPIPNDGRGDPFAPAPTRFPPTNATAENGETK